MLEDSILSARIPVDHLVDKMSRRVHELLGAANAAAGAGVTSPSRWSMISPRRRDKEVDAQSPGSCESPGSGNVSFGNGSSTQSQSAVMTELTRACFDIHEVQQLKKDLRARDRQLDNQSQLVKYLASRLAMLESRVGDLEGALEEERNRNKAPRCIIDDPNASTLGFLSPASMAVSVGGSSTGSWGMRSPAPCMLPSGPASARSPCDLNSSRRDAENSSLRDVEQAGVVVRCRSVSPCCSTRQLSVARARSLGPPVRSVSAALLVKLGDLPPRLLPNGEHVLRSHWRLVSSPPER